MTANESPDILFSKSVLLIKLSEGLQFAGLCWKYHSAVILLGSVPGVESEVPHHILNGRHPASLD